MQYDDDFDCCIWPMHGVTLSQWPTKLPFASDISSVAVYGPVGSLEESLGFCADTRMQHEARSRLQSIPVQCRCHWKMFALLIQGSLSHRKDRRWNRADGRMFPVACCTHWWKHALIIMEKNRVRHQDP